MKKKIAITIFVILLRVSFALGQNNQPSYKAMMEDSHINFYQVCDSAEAYFKTIDREKKGSGWKPFMRWRVENEPKFYPSGDRSATDFQLGNKEYQRILSSTPKNLFVAGWRDNGPYEIDSITGHYAAGLGRIENVWVHPNNANIIYLGSRSGGFAGTQDGGEHWISGTNDFLPASGVNSVTANPTNSNEILINCQNARNNYSHGIYRSMDGGMTWNSTNFIPANIGYGGLGDDFHIHGIKFHPTIPNLVFIATNKGLYRSTNNLITWSQLLPLKNIIALEFHPTNANYVYTYDNYFPATENKVYISSDQGATYYLSNEILGNNNDQIKLETSNQNPDNLYFSSSNGIWKSMDRGSNFSFISNPNTGNGGFAINGTDSTVLLRGYVDMHASTNSGALFNQKTQWSLGNTNGAGAGHQNSFLTSTNYIHADINYLDFIGGAFYVCTDGFLSKSTDNGITWVIISDSINTRENYCIGTSQSNHYRSIFGSQDNGTSIKTETGWNEFYGADGMDGLIHPLNDDWMINSYQYGKRLRTKSGGLNLETFTPPNSNLGSWIAPLELDPNNQMTYFDFRDSIYRSDDFGTNFNTLSAPSSFSGVIQTSAIAYNNSNVMLITKNAKIEKTVNGGLNFQNIQNNLPNKDISAVTINPSNDNHFVVTYADYSSDLTKIAQSLDGGITWTNITYNLGNMPIRSVVIDHSDSSYIYVGAEIGIYYKSKNATSWTLYNPNLPNVAISDLEICWGSNTLKAGTWGRGFWEYNLVGRANYPAILTTKINNPPTETTPKEGVDQFITSTIHYNQNLSSVYVQWSTNTPNFNNTIAMTNISDSTWQSTTPLPTFSAGTKMYFRVMAVGQNGDTTETHKFMYIVKPAEFCTASGEVGVNTKRIISTNIDGSITNSGDTDYQLYSNIVHPFYVDSIYNLSMTANSNAFDNDYSIWIDMNNDLDFTTNENVLSSVNQSVASVSTNYTIPPFVAVDDTVRMRMRVSYHGSTTTPCGTTRGEVEDYLVHLRKVPTLTYAGNNALVCLNTPLNLNYTGSNVDSLKWIFSGPMNLSFTGLSCITSSLIAGTYNLELVGYKYGLPFNKLYSNVLTINALPAVIANATSTTVCEGTAITLSGAGAVSYSWNNNVTNGTAFTPTSSASYTVTGTNANGCVNTANVAVTVNALPIVNVISNANSITASGATSYQWINCSTNELIVGQTATTFTPAANGSYACIGLNALNCSDTSICAVIASLSMSEFETTNFSIYPNPTQDFITITYNSSHEAIVRIFDATGKIFLNKWIHNETEISLMQFAKGIYYIQLVMDHGIEVQKVVKE